VISKCASPFKASPSLKSFTEQNEVVRLVDWINREANWKKSETKGSFIAQGLFGIIKDLHRKISCFKPTTVFSGYQTVELFEEYQRESELQKSKAIAHIRLQTCFV